MPNNRLFLSVAKGFSLMEILVAMAIISLLVAVAVPRFGNQGDKIAREEINRLLAAIHMVRDLAVIEDKEYGIDIDEKGYRFLVLQDTDLPSTNQQSQGKGEKGTQRSQANKTSSSSRGSGTRGGETKGGDGNQSQVPVSQGPIWATIEDNPALAEHEFPEEVEVNIAIDGDNLFAESEDDVQIFEKQIDIFEDGEEEEQIEPPKIYFLSTGEQNQFTIGVASIEDYQDNKNEPVFFRIKGELTGVLEYQGPLPGDLFTDILRDYADYLEQDE